MNFTLSAVLLLVSLIGASVYRRDILHPAFWTNIGFAGYSIGGLYYSLLSLENALFLNLAFFPDSERPFWMTIALLIVIACHLILNLGFWIADRQYGYVGVPLTRREEIFPAHIIIFGKVSALALITIGLAYYFYFADRLAGGILPMVGQVAVYRYLVADTGLSALPFHLIYGGALLWLMTHLLSPQHQWVGLIFIPLAAIIILSTGRIASANAYGFSAVLCYLAVTYGRVGLRAFGIGLAALLPVNVVFYFFRQYSSYAYLGRADDFPLAGEQAGGLAADTAAEVLGRGGYILRSLIGGGNIPDLQQIILVVHGLVSGRMELAYGSTYLDWIVNLAGSRIGEAHTGIQSAGYRILEAYFPDKVGGPTPGMIGEALLNFGLLAPIALLGFSYFMGKLFHAAIKSGSMLFRLMYCQFLISIWALFIKVDSSLLLGYLWIAGPICLCWIGLLFIRTLTTRRAEHQGS